MANLMDGRCRCAEFWCGRGDPPPCPVPGHPEGNTKPTPEPAR
jgi:hypothetical protein